MIEGENPYRSVVCFLCSAYLIEIYIHGGSEGGWKRFSRRGVERQCFNIWHEIKSRWQQQPLKPEDLILESSAVTREDGGEATSRNLSLFLLLFDLFLLALETQSDSLEESVWQEEVSRRLLSLASPCMSIFQLGLRLIFFFYVQTRWMFYVFFFLNDFIAGASGGGGWSDSSITREWFHSHISPEVLASFIFWYKKKVVDGERSTNILVILMITTRLAWIRAERSTHCWLQASSIGKKRRKKNNEL